MLTKGVLHVHSRFSDGEESLERLVEVFQQSGMQFAAVSDHAEVFDDRRMEEYVHLCEALTSNSFLVIPGLEFALKGGTIHILGYGIRKRVRFSSIEGLVDGIHDAGGIAVLAHPPVGSINLIGGRQNQTRWNRGLERYQNPGDVRIRSGTRRLAGTGQSRGPAGVGGTGGNADVGRTRSAPLLDRTVAEIRRNANQVISEGLGRESDAHPSVDAKRRFPITRLSDTENQLRLLLS